MKKNQNFSMIALLILVIGTGFLSYSLTTSNLSSHLANSSASVIESPDVMIRQTIDSISKYGINPANGQAYINWYISDPTKLQNPGHDGQDDLRFYEMLEMYMIRHPNDHTLDATLAKSWAVVQPEFANSGLPKGWYYYLYQRLSKISGPNNSFWQGVMQHWAGAADNRIDKTVGLIHGPLVENTGAGAPTCADGYRVDQTFETAVALIDAGNRFHNPQWIADGQKMYGIIEQQAFNQKYHLFVRDMCQGKIWNAHARNGEMGQEVEALVLTGLYTNNHQFLLQAQQMMDSIVSPATGLIDRVNGGLFFQMDTATGTVDIGTKRMQQFQILEPMHVYDKQVSNRYSNEENDLMNAVQKSFFALPVAGWMYEVSPTWGIYKAETWISLEASGIVGEGVQTVLADSISPPTSTLPPISINPSQSIPNPSPSVTKPIISVSIKPSKTPIPPVTITTILPSITNTIRPTRPPVTITDIDKTGSPSSPSSNSSSHRDVDNPVIKLFKYFSQFFPKL